MTDYQLNILIANIFFATAFVSKDKIIPWVLGAFWTVGAIIDKF